MIGNYAASNLPVTIPNAQDVLWINVVNGNDSTAQRNDPAHPFKTLNAALAASPTGSQDTYYIVPTGNTGAVNSVTSADVTISKPLQVLTQVTGPDTAPALLNTTLTITNNTRANVFFENVTFFNQVDKLCLDIQRVTDHVVWFKNCYMYNGAGTHAIISTSGAWDTNTTTGTRLVFESCTFGGPITHGAGTVGAPYDLKGQMVIKNHCRNVGGSTTVLTINSGSVQICDPSSMFPVILNGGAVDIINVRDISHLTSDGYFVKAADTDTIGKSFVTIRNFCAYNLAASPAATAIPKIKIGANVVYSLQNVYIPTSMIEIDAAAVELNAYLTSNSKANFVNYNSGVVYGAGSLLT